MQWADTIFCEWGLENAGLVFATQKPRATSNYSNSPAGKLTSGLASFGYRIDSENVDKFIFVSPDVRDQAVELFGWDLSKTEVIPNYVLFDEYQLSDRSLDETINLGMVGIIPQRKRLDRALDVAEQLAHRGYRVNLKIKGPRPENIPFMHAPGRVEELDFYYQQYSRIDKLATAGITVSFEDWGNDVALWYREVDHILSCSDF